MLAQTSMYGKTGEGGAGREPNEVCSVETLLQQVYKCVCVTDSAGWLCAKKGTRELQSELVVGLCVGQGGRHNTRQTSRWRLS